MARRHRDKAIPLTIARIRAESNDEALFDLLGSELARRLRRLSYGDLDRCVDEYARLPRGLGAMAATYQLDISMTLDDLGWHFLNWHNQRYAAATLGGLQELEAHEAAAIFAEAYQIILPHWDAIGAASTQDDGGFLDWYRGEHGPDRILTGLNERMWDLLKNPPPGGILYWWVTYARRYPDRVADN